MRPAAAIGIWPSCWSGSAEAHRQSWTTYRSPPRWVEVVRGVSDDSLGTSPLWWALALGADLGGNATIVGFFRECHSRQYCPRQRLPYKLHALSQVRRRNQFSDPAALHGVPVAEILLAPRGDRRTPSSSAIKRSAATSSRARRDRNRDRLHNLCVRRAHTQRDFGLPGR